MTRGRVVSLSLPSELVERIDAMRGDVTRSRFIAKLLREVLMKNGE